MAKPKWYYRVGGSRFAVRGSRFAVRGSRFAVRKLPIYFPSPLQINNLRSKYADFAISAALHGGRKVDRMAEIQSFRDLDAWQAGIRLVVIVYALVKKLPDSERFGLMSQMRRAAVSVPSNVAEGQATGPGGLYRRHVRIALGSWAELVTQLEVIRVLGLLAPSVLKDLEKDLERTGQLLHGLDRSLRRRRVAAGALALLVLGSAAVLFS